jgi:hypothetical protein
MKLAQKVVLYFISAKISWYSLFSKAKAAKYAFKLFCTPFIRVTMKMPAVFKQARKIHFSFDGFMVKGFESGSDTNRKLLIIHGWESSCYRFEQYIKPLNKMGIQVFCFDAIAHGQSEGKQLNIYQYAKMLAYINHKYGPFTYFMAHSIGCAALCISLSHFKPIVNTTTLKIVLFAPAVNVTYFFATFYKKLSIKKGVQKEIDRLVKDISGFPIAWFNLNKHLHNIQSSILWFHDTDDDSCLFKFVEEVIDEGYRNIQFEISSTLGHSGVYRDNKNKKLVFDFFNH